MASCVSSRRSCKRLGNVDFSTVLTCAFAPPLRVNGSNATTTTTTLSRCDRTVRRWKGRRVTTTTTTTTTERRPMWTCEAGGRPRKTRKAGSILTARNAVLPRLVPVARAMWRAGWRLLMSQLAPSDSRGRYVRPTSSLAKNAAAQVSKAVPTDTDVELTFYVGIACPWCHRVTLALALLGVTSIYRMYSVEPGTDGLWRLTKDTRDKNKDHHRQGKSDRRGQPCLLKDVYLQTDSDYAGRFTAPLLVDAAAPRLVSNESADLVDWLATRHGVVNYGLKLDTDIDSKLVSTSRDSSFVCVDLGPSPSGVNPDELARVRAGIHTLINDGVYRVGFSTSQSAYDSAEQALFNMLDNLEQRLQHSKFLFGNHVVTSADVRLFPTIFRFDAVYNPLFHASRKSIRGDYPALAKWLRRMYHLPGVKDTCALQQTVAHYFGNLFPLNPAAIVPATPHVDLSPLVDG